MRRENVAVAGDIMTRDAVTVRPDLPVGQALATMRRDRISGVPVVDSGGRLVGILTALDGLRHMARSMPWFCALSNPGLPPPDDPMS